jgi:Fe-Mn family superoxide dismutase
MKYELPKLPYGYDALEPYIDAKTMEIHYTKHHQTYVTKLNEALDKHPEVTEGLEGKPELESLAQLLGKIDALPPDIRTAVKNHGGGHANHSFFWTIMGVSSEISAKKEPSGPLMDAIKGEFGDFAKFKDTFSKTAAGVLKMYL